MTNELNDVLLLTEALYSVKQQLENVEELMSKMLPSLCDVTDDED